MRKLLAALPMLLFLMCAGTAHAAFSVPCNNNGLFNGVSSIILTFGCTTQSGDVVVVILQDSGNGNTLIDTISDDNSQMYSVLGTNPDPVSSSATTQYVSSAAGATELKVTTLGNSQVTLTVAVLRGITTLDVANSVWTKSSYSTSLSGASVTTTNANDVVFCVFQNEEIGGMTPNSPFSTAASHTSAGGGDYFNSLLSYDVVSSTGTYSPTATQANAGYAGMLAFAFEAGGSPPPATVVPRRR